MNYSKHYTTLIERAKNRTLTGYTEKHHIVPRCLGGNNKKENIVALTAREHYVAHQLLVKINPEHHGLIKAAHMMACASAKHIRANNRLYEWLRIKHSTAMSEGQSGNKNSQYGSTWISNLVTKQCIKVKSSELQVKLATGWIKKRIMNWDPIQKVPGILGRKDDQMIMFNAKLDEMIHNCKNGMSVYKSLRTAGFCGTGSAHKRLKEILAL